MDVVGPGGGSIALAELIDGHGDFVVADFADHYGLRLADVLFEWSPREVLALVEGLPDTSRLHAHFAGGEKWREHHGWGWDRHIQANLWDLHSAVNTASGKKPKRHPRPESAKKSAGGVNALLNMFPLRKE